MKTISAESEVERLLRAVLPGTPWQSIVKAVGGYVRDEYLALSKGEVPDPKDLDIVVGGPAGGGENFSRFLHEMFPEQTYTPRNMGKGYPIWQLVFFDDIGEYKTKGAVIEFADAMQERYPDPNSRQREVVHATVEQDIMRRDFTVNMLLKDMSTGEIEDLTGRSKKDIENGVLTGHPAVPLDRMFSDDPLRMMRLIRFNAKYGWEVPKEVIRAVQRNAERICIVSAERINTELEKVLQLGKLYQAVRLMSACGLLRYVLPEVQSLKGVKHDGRYHCEGDVYRHTLLVLKHAPKTREGQLAALLHDIGKPSSQTILADKIQFLGHEDVGMEMAEVLLKRLKFDNSTTDKVVSVVRAHMRPHSISGDNVSEKALRRFIVDMGDDLDAVLAQAVADRKGMLPFNDDAERLVHRIEGIHKKDLEMGAPVKLPLNGLEVMEVLGIDKPGPAVGRALNMLKDIQIEFMTNGVILDKDTAKAELCRRYHVSGEVCPKETVNTSNCPCRGASDIASSAF